jgi:hypothetical protein
MCDDGISRIIQQLGLDPVEFTTPITAFECFVSAAAMDLPTAIASPTHHHEDISWKGRCSNYPICSFDWMEIDSMNSRQ